MQALEAIVLAGGSGTRFGGGKLTHPWRGGVLIDGALATAFAAPARTVTVVTGADAGVEAAARAFAEADRRGGAAAGSSTARATPRAWARRCAPGSPACRADAAGAFVFLGDMPRIPPAILPALANALAAGAPAAAPRFEGQRGHPVLFAAALLPQLRALSGDQGARDVLRALGDRLALVETADPGVLVDVDQRGDLDADGAR